MEYVVYKHFVNYAEDIDELWVTKYSKKFPYKMIADYPANPYTYEIMHDPDCKKCVELEAESKHNMPMINENMDIDKYDNKFFDIFD